MGRSCDPTGHHSPQAKTTYRFNCHIPSNERTLHKNIPGRGSFAAPLYNLYGRYSTRFIRLFDSSTNHIRPFSLPVKTTSPSTKLTCITDSTNSTYHYRHFYKPTTRPPLRLLSTLYLFSFKPTPKPHQTIYSTYHSCPHGRSGRGKSALRGGTCRPASVHRPRRGPETGGRTVLQATARRDWGRTLAMPGRAWGVRVALDTTGRRWQTSSA